MRSQVPSFMAAVLGLVQCPEEPTQRGQDARRMAEVAPVAPLDAGAAPALEKPVVWADPPFDFNDFVTALAGPGAIECDVGGARRLMDTSQIEAKLGCVEKATRSKRAWWMSRSELPRSFVLIGLRNGDLIRLQYGEIPAFVPGGGCGEEVISKPSVWGAYWAKCTSFPPSAATALSKVLPCSSWSEKTWLYFKDHEVAATERVKFLSALE